MKQALGLIFYGALALTALAAMGYSVWGLVRAIRARNVRLMAAQGALLVLLAALCIFALGSEIGSGAPIFGAAQ